MLLINNLYGQYNAETAEGRGANAASNVVKYILEGKKIIEQNAVKLLKGEIGLDEASRNSALEALSQAYIPYTEISEETGELNIEYGMAFTTVYLNAFDKDGSGVVTAEEAGQWGHLIDQINPNGKITKGKFFAWLIFQDCIEAYNGVISPNEAGKAMLWVNNDPCFVVEKLREIYRRLKLEEKEESFVTPEPIKK